MPHHTQCLTEVMGLELCPPCLCIRHLTHWEPPPQPELVSYVPSFPLYIVEVRDFSGDVELCPDTFWVTSRIL